MRIRFALAGPTLALAAVCLSACGGSNAPGTAPPPAVAMPADLIARGEYLARAADCAACHSVPGGKPFAGGYPFKLPFGTIYSTNITADHATGIGDWTDDDFVRALQHGVARGGRHLYPAFPYTSYTGMARHDAVAIKAYLFSLPTVHAPARPNKLAFPFNQRWGMMVWNAVFLKDRRFTPDPNLNAQQVRGAYLATALGHCGECHTPRNVGFGLKSNQQFAGAVLTGWHAWNLTPDPHAGVGAWSDQQLAAYLNGGHADGHGSAAGPMGEAVENSLQYLTPQDTGALIAYLRTVKPQAGDANAAPGPAPAMTASSAAAPSPTEHSDSQGARIFAGACASCHQWNGQGQQTPYASLAGGQTVADPQGTNVMQVVLKGARLRTAQGAASMPAFGAGYSDQDIAAVSNYVIGHFGGKTGAVTPAMVHKARAD